MLQADGQGGESRLLVASAGLQEKTNPESRLGVPGCPIQPLLQKPLWGWSLGPQLPGEPSKYPPTQLKRGAQTRSETGQQVSFCPQKLLGFLLWMVFWNRPGRICYLIQKVSVNVIHLQINFSASGWVSNKKELPCGAQASLTCSLRVGASADLGPVASPTDDLCQVGR